MLLHLTYPTHPTQPAHPSAHPLGGKGLLARLARGYASLCMAERTGCPILLSIWSVFYLIRVIAVLFPRDKPSTPQRRKSRKRSSPTINQSRQTRVWEEFHGMALPGAEILISRTETTDSTPFKSAQRTSSAPTVKRKSMTTSAASDPPTWQTSLPRAPAARDEYIGIPGHVPDKDVSGCHLKGAPSLPPPCPGLPARRCGRHTHRHPSTQHPHLPRLLGPPPRLPRRGTRIPNHSQGHRFAPHNLRFSSARILPRRADALRFWARGYGARGAPGDDPAASVSRARGAVGDGVGREGGYLEFGDAGMCMERGAGNTNADSGVAGGGGGRGISRLAEGNADLGTGGEKDSQGAARASLVEG
ncbi:hypothetical protein V494_00403 [Pseudogymnoascus sp. VKM F-4513 (FW-928)]|nr:hypothetical protein V494_00403 [Pseudogymnoascus sp. VKM F-4513 (FW-928)]